MPAHPKPKHKPPNSNSIIKMVISKKILIIGIVVVVLIALGVWLGMSFFGGQAEDSDYSAVYLSTGDIYFGKLSWLPTPHMTDVWFLNRTVDSKNQPQVGVAPMQGVFWGPSKTVYLNPKNIILWTRLKTDSQLVKGIQQNAAGTQAGSSFQGPAVPPPGATSTAK